ncbi:Carbonic anhydrase 2 [Legionella massiliensis]|uniref:Carbonic anhydrase 2 n=1 Tax=Legionella massiliensis TaxID=1034943 RepID=A0A078KN19_9GAMM|nr:carbonic anhydrase [Legionella massiliensis]CDZ75760.1 Carbonic anhydrase 2 [Legionella massiliensis]CEE11498.1 Carbonic anhydrase 2 [Legionella massiliensis]
MFKKSITILTAAIIFLFFQKIEAKTVEEILTLSKTTSSVTQQAMTPKEALLRLNMGNQRFLTNTMKTRDYLSQAKQSSYGQFPWAVILNCMDSRSVPELVFDQGLADLFTLRVAGNVLNDDNLGSMEFATKVVGAKLIVVLAHTSCGAVAGACEGVNLGHLDHVLDKIKPVVAPTQKETGIKDCAKHELIDAIAKNNALSVARQIQAQSPIISDLLAKGQIGIVAGVHDIKTGKVTFFEEGRLLPSAPEASQTQKGKN